MAVLLAIIIGTVIVRLAFDLRLNPFRINYNPSADTVMIIVIAVCCSLIAALAVVQMATFFSSPEQRAKVREPSITTMLLNYY